MVLLPLWGHSCLPSVFLFVLCVPQLRVMCMNVLAQNEKFTPDYAYYHNLTQIQKEIETLSRTYSAYVKLLEYSSRESRSQFVLHISNHSSWAPPHNQTQNNNEVRNSHKAKLLFSFGEHAREFLPVESMIFLVKNITRGAYSTDPYEHWFSQNVLNNVDLYIIGLANPDGRYVVERTENYCWRGTKAGVDLQRNFDWEFAGKGSSKNPHDEEYHGEKPFSEPESVVFQDLSSKIRFDAFVSFHSGINQIYVPFADTKSKQTLRKPANIQMMLHLAKVLSKATVYNYAYGLSYLLNDYTADGTIFDYMAGVRKVPFSYTVELWGTSNSHKGAGCFDLFNPPNEKLKEVLHNLHPLYVSTFTFLISWKSSQAKKSHTVQIDFSEPTTQHYSQESQFPTFNHVLMLLLVFGTVLIAFNSKTKLCRGFGPRKRIVSLKALSSNFSKSV